MEADEPDEATQRRLLEALDGSDYDAGSGGSLMGTPPHDPTSIYNTPLPFTSFQKKRQRSQDKDTNEPQPRITKQKTDTHTSPTQTSSNINIKYTKLFIVTENITKLNYYTFNKLLTGNKYHTYISHIQRSKDTTGYIITFKQDNHAEKFQNTPFNNELDSCTMRKTHKPTRKIHTDILIHNVPTDVTNEEITHDITDNYSIQVHSTYRLTRKSKYPPYTPYNTNIVKITIDQHNEHLFTDKITLFTFNKHKTSKPTPPPTITQCYTCYNYGHTQQQCRQTTRTCIKCGKIHTDTCTQKQPTCLHCKQQHVPTYKNCPTYKNILQKAKQEQRSTYAQAAQNRQNRQDVATRPPTQTLYSSTTQPPPSQPPQRYLLPNPQPVPMPQRSPRQTNRTQIQNRTQPPHCSSPVITRLPDIPQAQHNTANHTHTHISTQETLQQLLNNKTPQDIYIILRQLITLITNIMDDLHRQTHSTQTIQCI